MPYNPTLFDNHVKTASALAILQGTEMGPYFLERVSEEMWSALARDVMLPACFRIVERLTALGITEENRLDFNDLDDNVWLVPTRGPHKAFVHTTQNFDYLYVVEHDDTWDKLRAELTPEQLAKMSNLQVNLESDTIQVRRIWREWRADNCDWKIPELIGSIGNALKHADILSEYTDYPQTAYSRPQRPSLAWYKSFNCKIPSHDNRCYGDSRDPGYILGYGNFNTRPVQVDHRHAKLIADCYLPAIEYALNEESDSRAQ